MSNLVSNIITPAIFTITHSKWLQSCYPEFVPVCLLTIQCCIVYNLQELLNNICREDRILSQYCPTLNHWPTNIFHKLRQLQTTNFILYNTLWKCIMFHKMVWMQIKCTQYEAFHGYISYQDKVLHRKKKQYILGMIWTNDTTYCHV